MSDHPRPADSRIDLFIDGLLEGEDLASFQRELERSPRLREQVEAQQRIDAGLRGLFAYDASRAAVPGPPAVIAGIDKAGVRSSRRAWPRRALALAAGLALVAAGAWSVYVNLTVPRVENLLNPSTVYAMIDKPEFVCTTDAEFAAAVRGRLGQPLVLASAPGVTPLGWAYSDAYNGRIVGRRTLVLICTVDDRKVLVFMDRLKDDRPIELPPQSGLNLYRRTIGPLVVYEVTPLPGPRVIDHLREPRDGR